MENYRTTEELNADREPDFDAELEEREDIPAQNQIGVRTGVRVLHAHSTTEEEPGIVIMIGHATVFITASEAVELALEMQSMSTLATSLAHANSLMKNWENNAGEEVSVPEEARAQYIHEVVCGCTDHETFFVHASGSFMGQETSERERELSETLLAMQSVLDAHGIEVSEQDIEEHRAQERAVRVGSSSKLDRSEERDALGFTQKARSQKSTRTLN